MVAAVAALLTIGAGLDHSSADQFFLNLQVDFLRNNGFVVIFHIVLRHESVVLNSGFIQKIGGVGLLEADVVYRIADKIENDFPYVINDEAIYRYKKGVYTGPQDFARNFPFVPYQFIIMQKVFAEIRKHGNSGKHLSGGERSMLSGFQEAAQKIQDKDEYALAPFYLFYDTVHTFLDSSIRRVIERCQKAADNGDGIEQQDVDVLKLLYLIRYVDDIPANLDNIVILSVALKYKDIAPMKRAERSALVKGMDVVYIYHDKVDEATKIIADKTSDNGQERTFRCSFNLKSLKYDNRASYYLVIADETGLQMPQKEEFQIDIAFAVDEFNFFS